MTVSRRDALGLSGAAIAGTALGGVEAGAAAIAAPRKGRQWWIDEPIRMALFLYNQYQAPVDTEGFVQNLVDLNANAVVLPVAGIAAFYPTRVPYHVRAPSLPEGRDLVGEIVDKAHARGIYVVGRFEWTVNQDKAILTDHPDWVQRTANGESPLWNDTLVMCINGGYMQEHIFKIMDEVLTRYRLDGMFFNYGGGQRNAFGPCHCANCQSAFKAAYNREIPARPDADYLAFMNGCADRLASKIRAFAKGRNPDINYMVGKDADSANSETHGAPIAESHALWLYDASETVNRARAAFPDRMPFNNDSAFLDGRWRYAHRPAPEGEARAYQNMANGAGPYLFVNGGHRQFDGNGQKGAAPAFRFHKEHEALYVRQENAARVLLLDEPGSSLAAMLFRYGPAQPAGPPPGNGGFGYRDSTELGSGGENDKTDMAGFFRLLTEQHVPFVVSSDLGWIDKDPGRYDLVVSARRAPRALDGWLRQGGRVLAAGAERPDLDLPATVRQWQREETLAAYWRVRDRRLLPSLSDADLVFFYSDYLELAPSGGAALTFVPPTKINPMEMVGENLHDTDKPGLYLSDYGKGRLAYLPWNLGDLYYRASAVHHGALVGDLVDHLLPGGRQIRTNAHPTVQMTLQHQKREQRTLVHFVNLSGAAQVAFHPAISMGAIDVEVRGTFSAARMASRNQHLPIRHGGGYTAFTLPALGAYDVVVLT